MKRIIPNIKNKMKIFSSALLGLALLLTSCIQANDIKQMENTGGTQGAGNFVSVQKRDDGKTVLLVNVLEGADTLGAERTVLPRTSNSDLKDIKLYGSTSVTNENSLAIPSNKLAEFATFSDLATDKGIVLDTYGESISGTWNFLLEAKCGGVLNTLRSDVLPVTISASTTTTLSFSLTLQSSGGDTGEVKIEIMELDKLNCSVVKADWYAATDTYSSTSSQRAYDDKNASTNFITIKGNEKFEKYAEFSRDNIARGSYYLTFGLYDSDGNLICIYPTTVVIEKGKVSYKKLTSQDFLGNKVELKVYTVTYNFNNGQTENNTKTQSFYPMSVLKGEYTSITPADATYTGSAPTGKRFRGWNTKADGTGTRYSPGENLNLSADLTLYAQWCSYDTGWKINDASDFHAFFCYSDEKASVYGSSSFPVTLNADVLNLENWTPANYSGTFTGGGKKLSYRLASYANPYSSLFKIFSGNANNLVLQDITISSTYSNSSGYAYVSALCSIAQSANISNVTLNNVKLSATGAKSLVGGLAATVNSPTTAAGATSVTISSCTVNGGSFTSTSSSETSLGAIAGYAKNLTGTKNKIVGTSSSLVSVKNTSTSYPTVYAGGIVGYAENSTFGDSSHSSYLNEVNFVDVQTPTKYVSDICCGGAFAGYLKDSNVYNAKIVYSKVTAVNAGGVVGKSEVTGTPSSYKINGSTFTMNDKYPIKGYYAGGIAGINGAYIGDFSLANVSVQPQPPQSFGQDIYIGGVAGKNTGTIASGAYYPSTDFFNTITVAGGSYATAVGGYVGINEGSIENARSLDVNSTISGNYVVGGVAGENAASGTITNPYSYTSKKFTITSSQSKSHIGGVVGDNYGSVTNACSDVVINNTGFTSYIAGVCAYNKGTLSASEYEISPTITNTGSSSYVAALCAYNDEGGVINPTHPASDGYYSISGTVTSNTDYSYIAGICAYNKGTVGSESLTNVLRAATLTVSNTLSSAQTSYVALGVAYNAGSVYSVVVGMSDSYSAGETVLTATGSPYAGGIVAYNASKAVIGANCKVQYLTLNGNNTGNYGYVVGKNYHVASPIADRGQPSTAITTVYNTKTTGPSTVDGDNNFKYINLVRTSKVKLYLQDYSGGAALYARLSGNGTTWYTSGKLDATSDTFIMYLEKGSYTLTLWEENVFSSCSCNIYWEID